jgi:hypothetical protein
MQQHRCISFITELQKRFANIQHQVISYFQNQFMRYIGRDALLVYLLLMWQRWEIKLDALEIVLFSFSLTPAVLRWNIGNTSDNIDRLPEYCSRTEAVGNMQQAHDFISDDIQGDVFEEINPCEIFHERC